MRSSASKPSCSMQATLKARTASRISGNCGIRSSGGVGPVRLVVGDRARCGRSARTCRRSPRGASAALARPSRAGASTAWCRSRAPRRPAARRLARQRRQRVIGAEDVARAVDQIDVVAFATAARRRGDLVSVMAMMGEYRDSCGRSTGSSARGRLVTRRYQDLSAARPAARMNVVRASVKSSHGSAGMRLRAAATQASHLAGGCCPAQRTLSAPPKVRSI